jgi:nitrate/nitrite-specific signal transduction histidine kinase
MIPWIENRLGQFQNTPLHLQLRRYRWMVFPAVLLLAALHQFTLYLIADSVPARWTWWVELALYSLTGSLAVWLGMTWIADAAARRAEAEAQLRTAFDSLEHNHRQLLALHDLGERVAAASDEQAIIELAARAPLQLTGAQASTVITFDDERERLTLDMAWGLSEAYTRALRAQIENGIPARRCQACTALKTHAESDCPLFHGLQADARAEGIRSLICMPVVRENERIGIISAYFPSADGPPADHIRLLDILGGTIAAALDSLRMRTRQVETLHALDRASENTDRMARDAQALDDLSAQVLRIAAAGWQAQAAALLFFDEETQAWEARATLGFDDIHREQRLTLALELVLQSAHSNRPAIQPDLDPTQQHGLRAAAATPLTIKGRVLGALFLGSKQRNAINENHTELLLTMTHQIALAIHNAQLYEQLGQMAVLQERYRLSREFHDGLAQTLGFLGFQAERVAELVADQRLEQANAEIIDLRQAIRAAYADVREAIDGLRFSAAEPGQIAARLAEYTTEFSRQTGIPVEFWAEPPKLNCDPNAGLQMLRIAQEALTNVRKHAGASRVRMELKQSGADLELVISDNGSGFPAKAASSPARHSYGLTTMRERAEGLGGSLTVVTNPGQGTRLTVNIPMRVKI